MKRDGASVETPWSAYLTIILNALSNGTNFNNILKITVDAPVVFPNCSSILPLLLLLHFFVCCFVFSGGHLAQASNPHSAWIFRKFGFRCLVFEQVFRSFTFSLRYANHFGGAFVFSRTAIAVRLSVWVYAFYFFLRSVAFHAVISRQLFALSTESFCRRECAVRCARSFFIRSRSPKIFPISQGSDE